MPSIPSGLNPIASGYSFGGPDGVMRTPVAGGMPRYALDFDRGSQQFKISLVLNAAQFSIWTTFYHFGIKKGSISFDMDLDSGYGVQTHTVNIIPGSYSVTRTEGIITVVSFTVEAESAAYQWTDDEAQALLDLWDAYADGGQGLLAAIAQFANVDSNVL
jgi:hypothetical protein